MVATLRFSGLPVRYGLGLHVGEVAAIGADALIILPSNLPDCRGQQYGQRQAASS
jgi:hypothetical protein